MIEKGGRCGYQTVEMDEPKHHMKAKVDLRHVISSVNCGLTAISAEDAGGS